MDSAAGECAGPKLRTLTWGHSLHPERGLGAWGERMGGATRQAQ